MRGCAAAGLKRLANVPKNPLPRLPVCGSLVMTTGMPIIAKTHQNKKTIWGKARSAASGAKQEGLSLHHSSSFSHSPCWLQFVPGNGNPVYNDAPSGSTIFEGYAGYGFVANENINEARLLPFLSCGWAPRSPYLHCCTGRQRHHTHLAGREPAVHQRVHLLLRAADVPVVLHGRVFLRQREKTMR